MNDWQDFKNWEESDDEDEEPVTIITKKQKDLQLLCVVRLDNRTRLLYTRGRQTTPSCDSCSSRGCKCLRAYKKFLEDKEKQRREAMEVDHYNVLTTCLTYPQQPPQSPL